MANKYNMGREKSRKESSQRKEEIRKLLERRKKQYGKTKKASQSAIQKKLEKLKNRDIARNSISVNEYKHLLKKPTTLNQLKTYKNGKRVFVVGGGESLSKINLDKLENEDTIVVNKTIFSVPNPTFFISTDDTFYKKIQHNTDKINRLRSSPAQKVFVANFASGRLMEKENFIYDPKFNMRYTLYFYDYLIKAHGTEGFGENLHDFYTGDNSGFCAVQLAYLLGYEEIYLLGLDLNAITSTHFHGGYGENITSFNNKLKKYESLFTDALISYKEKEDPKPQIISCSPISKLNSHLPLRDFDSLLGNVKLPKKSKSLRDLIVVSYYTVNTPYEKEAGKTIQSCKRLGLNHDIVGIKNLGNWQANTRYKAKFMLEMLEKYPDKRLLWVDCDDIIRKKPILFEDYRTDIAVRYQDFRWRKNECLSGTIYMENNARTKKLCEVWLNTNTKEGNEVNTFEQWNLDTAIQEMKKEGLKFANLPPEYTFIFDSMKKMYPKADPVIEHFQASRKFRKEVNKK